MAKPLVRPFLPDKSARKLALITGVIMFAFVSMHFLNHIVLLFSEEAAEDVLRAFKIIWRNPLGVVLLYGAFAIHFLLALRALYLMRHFDRRAGPVIQIIFGLSLPILIAAHVISARLPVLFNGPDSHYETVIRFMWSDDLFATRMFAAVLVAWIHGCIGVHAAISHREWYQRFAKLCFAAAIIIPTLTIAGIVASGQRVAPTAAASRGDLSSLPQELYGSWIAQAPNLGLSQIEYRFYSILALCCAFVVVASILRKCRENVLEIAITYSHGGFVRVPRGTSVLEASHIGHVDHYSACGGKGRCSTCRVRVLETEGPLPPPNVVEQATLARINATPDTRLSCQLRPDYDLVVDLQLLVPSGGDRLPRNEESSGGREKEILVMFSDLRNFTTIAENSLPYDIVFLLNSYFAILVQAIEAAGGRVDKYIGDGVMAIFDVDTRGPSEVCQRALGAAARIVAETNKLNKKLRKDFAIDLEVAIGMHYGPAIVGVVGYGKVATLTAIGDTVNVASRLENVAKQFNAAVAASETVMLLANLPHEGVSTQRIALKGRRLEMRVLMFSAEQIARYR
ncbi:2Fe-2S iron-sulfur cluster binding domain-containing protein [Agrobacterium sp. a22-2]|uniref:adenylate/guanylate cyclase domain-containing protein n=1 Tax=Agrobacterium sp. a22-2 TaxID=2283840 RepID=UPI0014480785|nr:adenylate/guanylate cyclase domain-containing protein [Agrobacterium sp. a22-2]NKN37532.1 2Fe-2S iron-sulfur cluster binding domain-containing protein [Agrobacterium sp. a22-2]